MPACNKCIHRHSAMSSMSLVGNATNDIRHHPHPRIRSLSKSIQLLVIIVGTAGTGKVLPHQREPAAVHVPHCSLQPQNERAHQDTSRRCQRPSRPQCSSAADHTVYSTRLEVGHLTVVDVKMSNRSRNSTSVEQCGFAFRGWHCCVVPILATCNQTKSLSFQQVQREIVIGRRHETKMRQFRKRGALIDHLPPTSRTSPAPASSLFPNGKRL